MSRIGKQIILIPEKTEVVKNDATVTVKGPLGELKRDFKDDVQIDIKEKEITLIPVKKTSFANALWGTYASHIKNMVDGVNKLFEKKLIVEGIGFKVNLNGNDLVLNLGFSHEIKVKVPEGLKVEVANNEITISGISKEVVGSFSAKIREYKKPEPYKGKGIRYHDEVVRRKEGKKSV